ncbi:hypothetical protein [Candidatus Pantoea bituminis]|uniref:hypothetical protein n=1 Tax=Candidatus Pantoea bituminis TaxID=2831036 RepID=UPI001C060DE2|nr:hypothetical protein [Pantoea bituminis]
MQADVFSELQQLVTTLSRSRITKACIKSGDATLSLSFAEVASAAGINTQNEAVKIVVSDAPATHIVTSPGMGYFRRNHPLSEPVVLPGMITAGQVVGYLQFEEVVAEVIVDIGGAISEPLVEENAVVGYGEPLFVVS